MTSFIEKESRNYGKRICLVCGTTFDAKYAAQLTCCDECRKMRGNMLKSTREKMQRKEVGELKNEIIVLRNEVRQLRQENQDLHEQLTLCGVRL